MPPDDFDRFAALLRDTEARLTSRIDEVRTDLAETKKSLGQAESFQAGLQGAAKIGLFVLTAVGIIIGIYVGLHGLNTGTGVKP